MAAQNHKKNLLARMPITPKPIIKALDSLDSFRPYERLLENDFQTSSTKHFFFKKSKFWRPGNQPTPSNPDLNFVQVLLHI